MDNSILDSNFIELIPYFSICSALQFMLFSCERHQNQGEPAACKINSCRNGASVWENPENLWDSANRNILKFTSRSNKSCFEGKE